MRVAAVLADKDLWPELPRQRRDYRVECAKPAGIPTNFFTLGWRGGRGWTWITGVAAFIVTILTSFTGFLMMTNWDAQWVAQQAKDAFNALGIGAVWNVMDAGQQFTMHVVITTGLLLFIVSVHLGLIRRRGVAPPPGAEALEVPDGEPRYAADRG